MHFGVKRLSNGFKIEHDWGERVDILVLFTAIDLRYCNTCRPTQRFDLLLDMYHGKNCLTLILSTLFVPETWVIC